MKIPIVKYNDKFLNSISWFMKVGGFTFFPYIWLREKYKEPRYKWVLSSKINHESIHIEQQKELLVIFFYAWYLIEWFIRLFMKGNAYRNISFEKEAYSNKDNMKYLETRKRYSFFNYF